MIDIPLHLFTTRIHTVFSLVGGFSTQLKKYMILKMGEIIFTITFRGENTKGLKIHHLVTPRKINMEPKNHPIEKENHLNQTIIFRFHVNLPGCIYQPIYGIITIRSLEVMNLDGMECFFSPIQHHTHGKMGKKSNDKKKEDRRFRCFGLGTNFECSRKCCAILGCLMMFIVLHYICRGC